MKAKFIDDVLFETFTEDSDPIRDMGIGRTKYRGFQPKDCSYKILQYLKRSTNIFGKKFEKWEYVPLPLTKKQKKEKWDDDYSETKHAYYYYISAYREDLRKFINKWPIVSVYLKYVRDTEQEIIDKERRRKQEEEDKRYEYFD